VIDLEARAEHCVEVWNHVLVAEQLAKRVAVGLSPLQHAPEDLGAAGDQFGIDDLEFMTQTSNFDWGTRRRKGTVDDVA
jgi:hypothetical protein